MTAARPKITMPEPVHRTSRRVLYADTDAGGVVYYANYLHFFEQGRTEFMRELVTPYSTLEAGGYILPVVESYIRYKASARYDDLLVIETSLAEVRAVSCRFHCRIIRESDTKLLAKGYTVHAVVDRSGKLAKLPEDLVQRLTKLCNFHE